MRRTPKLYEQELYSVWQSQAFQQKLTTKNGDEIDILHPGEFNRDSSGPDFLNARVKIGNLTYVGDVEIDREYNDWKQHGHNIDKKYNKVVLHVCFLNKFNQSYVYTKEGRKIPSLCLSEFIEEEEVNKINKHIEERKKELTYKLRCLEHQEEIPLYIKRKFVAELGIKRFEKKCLRMFSRLKELRYIDNLKIKEPDVKYDLSEEYQNKKFNPDDFKNKKLWQQLLYEYIFEALGYSKNKAPMIKLARLINLDLLSKLGHDDELPIRLESLYFNVAGLSPSVKELPEKEKSVYTVKLNENWDILKRIYDGSTMDETEWRFFKLRPHNFPTIRIAGGIEIVKLLFLGELIPDMIKKVIEIRKTSVLIGALRSLFIIKSHGYWQSHYVFDKKASGKIKYFIGASRADEIMVNVILPFLSVYFEVFGKGDLAKKVLQVYSYYFQQNSNKIVSEVAENIGMTNSLKKTIFIQGMIELFRSYCSKNKCLECNFGKMVFN